VRAVRPVSHGRGWLHWDMKRGDGDQRPAEVALKSDSKPPRTVAERVGTTSYASCERVRMRSLLCHRTLGVISQCKVGGKQSGGGGGGSREGNTDECAQVSNDAGALGDLDGTLDVGWEPEEGGLVHVGQVADGVDVVLLAVRPGEHCAARGGRGNARARQRRPMNMHTLRGIRSPTDSIRSFAKKRAHREKLAWLPCIHSGNAPSLTRTARW